MTTEVLIASRPPNQAENLADAFRLFNRVSAELTEAYASLQNQAAGLTAELAQANGELRRQYQEKARLSERLALLLDALPAGVVVLDHAGTVEQCNPATDAIFGAAIRGAAWHALSTARLTATETSGEWTTGIGVQEKRIAVAETDLDSAGGRIVLMHDVTAAHHVKRQAERNEHLASMGEMAAALAHQLRTPLAAALLYAGNLTRPGIAAEDRAALAEKTVARLKYLERLIQDMLIFARGESAGREWFEASALVTEVTQIVEPLARERGVDFTVSSDGAHPALIHGDRKAVMGAFINLLENALQACDAGGRVDLVADFDGAQITFRVRDDGRGVDPKVRGRLFEPFFTTRATGTGLGLAIARGVVRAHGGAIDLAADTRPGTEFIVHLPARPAVVDAAQVSDYGSTV